MLMLKAVGDRYHIVLSSFHEWWVVTLVAMAFKMEEHAPDL
jgi:hypothetical protein